MKLTCLSGGAKGSDNLFAILGKELGYKTYNMSFKDHNCCKEGIRIVISQEELNERLGDYKAICKRVGRKESSNSFIRNLMLRNTYQIKGKKSISDLVIAIGTYIGEHVDGGTGYAVDYAKCFNIPIILLDKISLNYYYWNYDNNTWDILSSRKLENIIKSFIHKEEVFFTGIGSRNIDMNACKERITKLINYIRGQY